MPWKGAGDAGRRVWGREPCGVAGALAWGSAPGLIKVGVAEPGRGGGPGPRSSPESVVRVRGSWDRNARPRWGPASEDRVPERSERGAPCALDRVPEAR